MKLFLLVLMMMICTSAACVPNVQLRFDPVSGATGYRIEVSEDFGATGGGAQDTGGSTEYVYTAAAEDALLLFRVAAYNATQEAIRAWSGAWYDNRLLPYTPSGAGIK